MDIDTAPVEGTATEEHPTDTAASDDSGSLSDHEAQFQPDAPRAATAKLDEVEEPEGLTRDEEQAVEKVGKFARHRAGSQRATPEDVQQINALTKELRAKEAELTKLDPKALEGSPRLRVLSRQIKAIEAELADRAPKPAPVEKPKSTPNLAAQPSSTFDEPEPDIEQFKDDPDPVKAWIKAQTKWDRKRELFEERQEQAALQRQQEQAATVDAFTEKYESFAKATPDFERVAGDFVQTTFLQPILLNAIMKDLVDGPASVYYLAQHPEVVEELNLLTYERPVTDAHVAYVQRRLKQLTSSTQAATTGSAPRTPSYVPPRPPNPVRTGPIRAGNELPGDDASLAEHERAYSRHRR